MLSDANLTVRALPGCSSARLGVLHTGSFLYGAFLYGRAGHLTAKPGGFRPGQCLDELARLCRDAPAVPFGGLQLLLSGDFLQLPPVRRARQSPY